MSHDFFVSVSDHSPRAADFDRVYGRHTRIPVRSPVPTTATLPGLGTQTVYELALDQLTPDERARLVAWIAERFGVPASEVDRDLEAVGMPIRAGEDLSVLVLHPQKWLD